MNAMLLIHCDLLGFDLIMCYNDDCICDESYNVESFEEFYRDNIHDENDERIMREFMIPCINCGELVSKQYIKPSGMCTMCETSDSHKYHRGTHNNAGHNQSFQSRLMNEWSPD